MYRNYSTIKISVFTFDKIIFISNINYANVISIISLFNLNNIKIIDLVISSKLESSKSEIRRLIKGRAIKINKNNLLTFSS